VSSHSHLLGRSQDIIPTPEQQCLCHHTASHVTLTCMCYGLRSLISPALKQLMIWEGDNTPWKAQNPVSGICSVLFPTFKSPYLSLECRRQSQLLCTST
jgi:hypothetical protein